MTKKKIIGMTVGRGFDLYADWIKGNDELIEILPLSYARNNIDDINKCEGIVFTGGEDVHPDLYKHPDYLQFCEPPDFDIRRDEFEWTLLDELQNRPIPLLGICRGLQLINVYYGGTLIPDLVTWGKFPHMRFNDGSERLHNIFVDINSDFYNIVKTTRGEVNSVHHQSADKIAKGLVVCAMSDDGIVEAIELKNKSLYKSFFCLVQWHPERMEDTDSAFVKPTRASFLKSIESLL